MKVNIFSHEWCDLVFENKNKEYGAYESRQLENKRTLIAIITASALFILIFSFPLLIKAVSPSDSKANAEVTKLSVIKILEPNVIKPEMIYEEAIPARQLRKTIVFQEPKIVNIPDETEELPTQENLNRTTTAIGSINNPKGSDDPTAAIPKTIPKDVIVPPEPTAPLDIAFVDQKPMFPGGEDELIRYILKHIQYPDIAKTTNITGTVYLQFVINKEGRVTDVRLLRSVGGGCDEEAIRVVSNLPLWQAGKHNGKPVSVRMTLPIKFILR